jgi:beta-mannanase
MRMRSSAFVLFAAAAVTALLTGSAGAATVSASAPSNDIRTLRSTHSVLFGVAASTDGDAQAPLAQVAAAVGKTPAVFGAYVSFASPNFDRAFVDSIRSQGATPMITWEPWGDGSLGPAQPRYSLARLLRGDFDAYIRRWAVGAKAWGGPLLLRFAPEMNGDWNSWSPGVNGNSASEYVAVWRHVHALFDAAGAENVRWVWSPNASFPGSTPLRSLYPGDAYVDWVGIDGYNWGTTRSGTRWQTFDQVFVPTIRTIRGLTKKPLILAEIGSAEAGGNKARWISDFFGSLRRNPDILAFVWFDFDKETDWRPDSSSTARAAFAAHIADRRYVGAADAPAR